MAFYNGFFLGWLHWEEREGDANILDTLITRLDELELEEYRAGFVRLTIGTPASEFDVSDCGR
jgi:hypothetical protein